MTTRLLKLLLRLLLVGAGYAAMFAVFWSFGFPDRLWALLPGTFLGLPLVLIRANQIGGVFIVGIVTLLGTVLGYFFLVPNVGNSLDGPWPEFRAALVGPVIGGIVALVIQELRARKSGRRQSSQSLSPPDTGVL